MAKTSYDTIESYKQYEEMKYSPLNTPLMRNAKKRRFGQWEPTPWWMIFRPSMRRRIERFSFADGWWPIAWEYQHPAFVAREALEEYCAPKV